MTSSQIFSVWPSHLVNKYIFFLLELMKNYIFETDPVKKNALSHTVHFPSSRPNRLKRKFVQCFDASRDVPPHILERVFNFCNSGCSLLSRKKKDMSNTTSKLIATVEIKLQYIKQPKSPSFKPFETKLNPWFVLLCTFGDDGVLGPPKT